MAFDFDTFRKENPKYDDLPDDRLIKYLHGKFYSDIPFKDFSRLIEYEDPNAPGDIKRGFTVAFEQIPQLAHGVEAAAGAVIENRFGEGGVGTAIKQHGLEGYKEWGDKIAEDSKESDSIRYSWEKAKQGDIGALADWVQYGLGYAGGQVVQMLATSVVGGYAGKVGIQTVAKAAVEKMVAKEAATIAAKQGAATLTADIIRDQAVKNVALKLSSIGATAAVGTTAVNQETGEILGDALSEAEKQGKKLTGDELARGFGTGLMAGGVELIGDMIALGALKGKGIGKGLVKVGSTMLSEGMTEGTQTAIEEVGKGNEEWFKPVSEETQNQMIESSALGAVGGGGVGMIGAIMAPKKPDDDTVPPEVPPPPPGNNNPPPPPSNTNQKPPVNVMTAGSVDEAIANANAELNNVQPEPIDLNGSAGQTEINVPGPQGLRHAYDQFIEDSAARHGIPADLLRQVALKESGMRQFDDNGKPLTPGTSNAVGVMQIIPRWHPEFDPERLANDPAYNIDAGAKFLRQLSDQNEGDVRKILERYYGSKNTAENQAYADSIINNAGKTPNEGIKQESTQTQPSQSTTGIPEVQGDLADNLSQFQPTHELSDGTRVRHVEGNTYVDETGSEIVDDYAEKLLTDTAKQKKAEIDAAAHQAALSPQNDLSEPTEAQKEAGNYKKGHVNFQGLDLSIENPKGSERSGVDRDGKKWSITMNNHYGYIKKSTGADGDHVDVFLGDNPESPKAFVVNQVDPKTGEFDEHKVMLGFDTMEEARAAYQSNYAKGWKGAKSLTEIPVSELQARINSGEIQKPIHNGTTKAGDVVANAENKAADFDQENKTQEFNQGKQNDFVSQYQGDTLKAEVFKNSSKEGYFNVVVSDTESGQTFPQVKIYPNKEWADFEAQKAAGLIKPDVEYTGNKNQTKTATTSEEDNYRNMSLDDFNQKHPKPYSVKKGSILTFDLENMSDEDIRKKFSWGELRIFSKVAGGRTSGSKAVLLESIRKQLNNRKRMRDMAEERLRKMNVDELKALVKELGGSGFGSKDSLIKEALAWYPNELKKSQRMIGSLNHAKEIVKEILAGKTDISDQNVHDYHEQILENINKKDHPELWERAIKSMADARFVPPFNAMPHVIKGLREQASKQENEKDSEMLIDLANEIERKLEHTEANYAKSKEERNNDKSENKTEKAGQLQETGQAVEPEPKGPTEAELKAERDEIFANNKLFTQDKVEAARERLKKKLGTLNSGIDPELLVDGMMLAGAYIEGGIRTYAKYSDRMVRDLGEAVRPYLASFYEAARRFPGLDTEGMTSTEDVDAWEKENKALTEKALKDTDVKGDGQVKVEKSKPKPKGMATLTQDWGVEEINGYDSERDDGKGGAVKTAFLKESKKYLEQVATILGDNGFMVPVNQRGKVQRPVSVNESGVATSGDVYMKMQKGGVEVKVSIGETSVRSLTSHPQRVAILLNIGPNGANQWLNTDMRAGDLAADIIDKHKRHNEITAQREKAKEAAKSKEEQVQNATNNEKRNPLKGKTLEERFKEIPQSFVHSTSIEVDVDGKLEAMRASEMIEHTDEMIKNYQDLLDCLGG